MTPLAGTQRRHHSSNRCLRLTAEGDSGHACLWLVHLDHVWCARARSSFFGDMGVRPIAVMVQN